MIKKLLNFFKDEEGATMVEYALMVTLVAVFCVAAVTLMRDQVAAAYNAIAAAF
jgi:pilus assembly protein Flp/PilA